MIIKLTKISAFGNFFKGCSAQEQTSQSYHMSHYDGRGTMIETLNLWSLGKQFIQDADGWAYTRLKLYVQLLLACANSMTNANPASSFYGR